MKTISPAALLLALLTFSLTASANYGERWYNVEIIIFAHNNDAALQEEHWPADPGTPDTRNTVSLVGNAGKSGRLPGQVIEYERLPIKMLSSALGRLKRSARYRVIYSTAWRLPYLRKHQAPAVRIKAGQRYTGIGESAPQPGIRRPTHTEKVSAQVLGQTADNRLIDDALYEIDGRIKISLSKYLDVDADLLFRDHVFLPDAQGVPTREFRRFRLTEYRRMKSNTIHYLDHPLFGVIIGIDRYEPGSLAETLGGLTSTD